LEKRLTGNYGKGLVRVTNIY